MKKGSFGYLKKKRILSAVKSLLLLAAVFICYFAALRHFHTNKNIFSIAAALGALPAGRSIVMTIMLMRARGASEYVRAAVDAVRGLQPGWSGYDLCLTAYDTAFSLSHAAVTAGRVVGLTENPQTNCRQCEDHIRQILEKDGLTGYEVRIYDSLEPYRKALEDLAALAGTSALFCFPLTSGCRNSFLDGQLRRSVETSKNLVPFPDYSGTAPFYSRRKRIAHAGIFR